VREGMTKIKIIKLKIRSPDKSSRFAYGFSEDDKY
jgi:hypothetical protein